MKTTVICKCGHSNRLHNRGCRLPQCNCTAFVPVFASDMLWDATDDEIAGMPNYNDLVQAQAKLLWPEYNADDYNWSECPPDDVCLLCYEWRRFPPGQRHFGYAGWRICGHDCTCKHHEAELWMA